MMLQFKNSDGVERKFSVAKAAEMIRKLNIGESVAFESLASVLIDHDTVDRPISKEFLPSPYVICELVRDHVASTYTCSDGPYPSLPSCDEKSITIGWGRSIVEVVWEGHPMYNTHDQSQGCRKLMIRVYVPDNEPEHPRAQIVFEYNERSIASPNPR